MITTVVVCGSARSQQGKWWRVWPETFIGQVGPATGSSTTVIAFGTTFLTVAGGVVVGYLALLRDRRQNAAQAEKDKNQEAENTASQSELRKLYLEFGKLQQAVTDLVDRVDRLETRPLRSRSRRGTDTDAG